MQQFIMAEWQDVGGLNPCFNGRCTRTFAEVEQEKSQVVGLNPCFNGRCTRTAQSTQLHTTHKNVLILVLMEDALVLQNLGNALFKRIVRLNCASKDLYLTNFMYLFSECKSTYFYGEAQNFYVKVSVKPIKCR